MWAEGVFVYVCVCVCDGQQRIVGCGNGKRREMSGVVYIKLQIYEVLCEYGDVCLSLRRTMHLLMVDCKKRMNNVFETERYKNKDFSVVIYMISLNFD